MYLHHSLKFNNILRQIYHVSNRNVNAHFMVQLKGIRRRVIKRIVGKTRGEKNITDLKTLTQCLKKSKLSPSHTHSKAGRTT